MASHPPLIELRNAIRRAGYRMDAFAEMIGERPDYFSRMLAGGRPPKKDLFSRAAAVLQRRASELMPDSDGEQAA